MSEVSGGGGGGVSDTPESLPYGLCSSDELMPAIGPSWDLLGCMQVCS